MTSMYVRQEATIQRLVREYENRPCNITELAKANHVPYQRLYSRLKRKHPQRDGSRAPNATLTPAQEMGLIQYVDFLDIHGDKARRSELSTIANRILHNDGQTRRVSKHFAPRFLKKHAEFFVRKQKPLSVARKAAQDPEVILKRFEEYEALRAEHGILDEDTWNFDETGFRIGVGRSQWIMTRDKHRKLTMQDPENREFLTSIECISGSGKVIDPYIIMCGRQYMEKWFDGVDMPDNTSINMTPSGYSNDDIAMDFLEHFNDNTRPKGEYRMLIMDGHGSHTHSDFATRCDELKIVPFQLVPHTTHICQPLDVVCFQPLKHYHGQAIDRAVRNYGDTTFNKVEFLATFQDVRMQAFTSSTILSSFRATGLIPYNPDRVLDKIRDDIRKAEREEWGETSPTAIPAHLHKHTNVLLKTPSHESTKDFLMAFKQFDATVKKFIGTDDESANLWLPAVYEKLSKGIQAKLHAGALAEEKIATQQAAITARQKRGLSNRKIKHTEGRLTFANARRRITERKEDDEVKTAALRERKKTKDWNDWQARVRAFVFCGRPLSYQWTDPNGQRSRAFPLNIDSLRHRYEHVNWEIYDRSLPERLEEKRLLDEEMVRRCEALNPLTLLSSSPVRAPVSDDEDEDEEAFGFMPIPLDPRLQEKALEKE